MEFYSVKIKALTPIWTGDANGRNSSLRETGILGSLRWWYEALIRGLGGNACDPTKTACNRDKHCDACELFGCTGWSRKFRLEVEKESGGNITLKFIPLKEVEDIEWALLNKTINIIAKYGALGGRIAEQQYGLIEIIKSGLDEFSLEKIGALELKKYLIRNNRKGVENPNIRMFVSITKGVKYKLLKDLKKELSFLKGERGKGKRYFYKTLNGQPYRLFLYAENETDINLALNIANKEIQNRPTTKSYVLLAWVYHKKGNAKKALEIIEKYVAGKTSEPTVLYHMAEIYKANKLEQKIPTIKKKLLNSLYELGPNMTSKIHNL